MTVNMYKAASQSFNTSFTARDSCHCDLRQQIVTYARVLFLAIAYGIFLRSGAGEAASIFQDCGGLLQEPQGVVQSPGFPGRFPLPLSCRWIIHAPPGKKIILYFTQYFLREAFYVTEYDQYESEVHYTGRKSLGQINFEDHIHTVVAYKPYLILDFRLHHMINIHLRVEAYLEDVYGFNITYEIVDRSDRVRQDTCSVNDCSFLGHCVASADFSTYHCACFPRFFGSQCQYGPYCDPDKGINMCLNKGRCRYFYGSTVNVCECPPGYEGPTCEQHIDSMPTVDSANENSWRQRPAECVQRGCSDLCERNGQGHLYCVCQEGYELGPDNLTCLEQRLFRVSVTVPLVIAQDNWNREMAASHGLTILMLTGLHTMARFRVDSVNDSVEEEATLRFHFYVDSRDLARVQDGVDSLLRDNHFFNLTVISTNRSLHIDPEMKLVSVENYDDKPALEGKSLTLMCTARGSRRLQFRWYKDHFLFNASLTTRSAWEVRIQDDHDDKQMSIFNVDGVTMFDKGKFSCEIEDFGEVQNMSLTVDVMPLPQVEIKPLTANMLAGQAVSFRCLSPDENTRTFSYQWLRDGRLLVPTEMVNGEMVEDLLPSGSRLHIPRLKVSANYTCRVHNKAGAAQKSAFVYVISPNMSSMTCDNNPYQGVRWNRTYGGHFDLQKCPIDTADFKVVGLGEGYARRDCVCKEDTCAWGPPNYARCHSIHLVFLYEQLERCQLGYQHGDLGGVYDSLYRILRKAQNRTLAGDVDMFAINLYTLFHVTLSFPDVAPKPSQSSFNLSTVAAFMNMLLDEVKTTNHFEKRDLSVGARLIRVCEILAELTRENPSLIPLANLTLPSIGFVVKNVTLTSTNGTAEREGGVSSDPGNSETIAFSNRHLMTIPVDQPGAKDDSEEAEEEEGEEALETEVEVLQVTFALEIYPILRVGSQRPEYVQFLTPLVSFLPVGDRHLDYNPLDDTYKVMDGRVELEFVHPPQELVKNFTECVAWDRSDSTQLVGEWNSDLCDVTYRTANITKCLCPVPGHFAVVLTATNSTLSPVPHGLQDTVLLVGCILCVCGLAAALLVFFVYWRHLSGVNAVIHLNLMVCLAAINLVCLLCLSPGQRQTLCIMGKVVLHFLQLAAFSFLLMEAIHTYVCIQSSGFSGLARIKYTCLKYLLTGWGIPVLATLAVALLSQVFGFDNACTTWCWWSSGQWQHYSFLVPLVVMVLVQVLIMSACLVCTRTWTDEQRFRNRKKYRLIVMRSFVLQTLLVLLSTSGHLVESWPSLGRQWFFISVDIFLTASVVTTLLIFKPHVRKLVYSILLPAHKRALSSGSFRAFVLPDRVEDTEEAEVKRIQQYCTEYDRTKFTTEHKQTLRNLLGSSSSGSDASASGTVSPTDSVFVPGQTLPPACRNHSSDSCSDCGGVINRGVRVEGTVEERKVGTRKSRSKRDGQSRDCQGANRCARCREGLPPQRTNPLPPARRYGGLVGLGLGDKEQAGQQKHVPDSGYEGTESDNPSLPPRTAEDDPDSPISSDSEVTPRQTPSPFSSPCTPDPPPLSLSHLLLPGPICTLQTSIRYCGVGDGSGASGNSPKVTSSASSEPSRDTDSYTTAVEDFADHQMPEEDCEVTLLPEVILQTVRVNEPAPSAAASAEHETLLTADSAEGKTGERDTFL